MRNAPGQDEADFKPFFDMVIGVLFVFMIMIAAQIFFARWADPSSARSEQEQRAERDRQASAFLNALSERLAARGIPSTVDIDRRTVVLPLAAVLSGGAAGRPATAAGAGVAGAVAAELVACLPEQPARPAPASCPPLALLRLLELTPSLVLGGWPGEGAEGERFGRLALIAAGSALVEGGPDLVAATRPGGAPALRYPGELSFAPDGGPPGIVRGSYALRFTFAP